MSRCSYVVHDRTGGDIRCLLSAGHHGECYHQDMPQASPSYTVADVGLRYSLADILDAFYERSGRRVHDLKTHPEMFSAVADERKPFELRKDDREFRCGDVLLLREWDPKTKQYTGMALLRIVSYRLAGEPWLAPGYVAMGIQREAWLHGNGYAINVVDDRPSPIADPSVSRKASGRVTECGCGDSHCNDCAGSKRR